MLDWTTLPLEAFDTILSFLADSATHPKCAILQMAQICKPWVPAARRRLRSAYFPNGKVRINEYVGELSKLDEILHSPLSTLGPGYVQTLYVGGYPNRTTTIRKDATFFEALVKANYPPLPSLHTLIVSNGPPFTGIDFEKEVSYSSEEKERGEEEEREEKQGKLTSETIPSPTSLLSQVKHIEICNDPEKKQFFENDVHLIRFCTRLEKVTIRSGFCPMPVINEMYDVVRLPPTLRAIDADVEMLKHLTEWLIHDVPTRFRGTITDCKVKLSSFEDDLYEKCNVGRFFGGFGKKLEKLEIYLDSYQAGWSLELCDPSNNVTQCQSLTTFRIRGIRDPIVQSLPHFFSDRTFGPRLERLEIIFTHVDVDYTKLVTWLDLDIHLRSRPTLRRIVFSRACERSNVFDQGTRIFWPTHEWKFFEARVRECLPRCAGSGILEFKQDVDNNCGRLEGRWWGVRG